MLVELEYLEDRQIYETVVLEGILKAKRSIWIATANVKDLQVKIRGRYRSIVEALAPLIERDGEVRLLHSSLPSRHFRDSVAHFRKTHPEGFGMRTCRRVHFKTVIIDMKKMYLGSGNLTGAGIGARRDSARNFEVGIWTENVELIDRIASLFNLVYDEAECDDCEFDCRIRPD